MLLWNALKFVVFVVKPGTGEAMPLLTRSNVRRLPPVVSKARVPPASVTGPVPRAAGRKRLTATVPSLMLRPPEKALVGLRSARVPEPTLVRAKAPLTGPPKVKVEAATASVRLAVKVTVPWPRLRFFVPVKLRSPPRLMLFSWALLTLAVPALSRVIAPVMVTAP